MKQVLQILKFFFISVPVFLITYLIIAPLFKIKKLFGEDLE
jgi:hypothetical protein